jgi:hypothetical protein
MIEQLESILHQSCGLNLINLSWLVCPVGRIAFACWMFYARQDIMSLWHISITNYALKRILRLRVVQSSGHWNPLREEGWGAHELNGLRFGFTDPFQAQKNQ